MTYIFTNQKALQQFQVLLSSFLISQERKKWAQFPPLCMPKLFTCLFLLILDKIITSFLQTKTLLFQVSCKETSRYTLFRVFCFLGFFFSQKVQEQSDSSHGPFAGSCRGCEDCLLGSCMHRGEGHGLWSLNVHHAPVLAQSLTIYVTMDITLTSLCLKNTHL